MSHKLLADLERMGAQCLGAHANIRRQKMRQHVGGDAKGHQGGEMGAQPQSNSGVDRQCDGQVTQRSTWPQLTQRNRGSCAVTLPNGVASKWHRRPLT